ncbi:BRO-N domain-containing protein [Pseudomonas asplenii]|uniref:BRO family, N-terminal domain n=1 Tax=Pseudomonas asplenii TaxID=53407 RepID=A0A1H6P2F6_9PSED|nr:Bro-N domain-containing protein [Pseudomonas fuscovaginae]SEI23637.1 BRO family, N-terminal domain [Pseudomonas fuscovaginae]
MSLVPFEFKGAFVRVVTDEHGEPWFVAKDVCELLGYANPSDAVGRHCKGVVKRYPLETGGGVQEVRVLSEGDTLRLIVNSTMPAAQEFESWVFDEVLPTIRKTGSYQRPMTPGEQLLAQAQAVISIERQQAEQQVALERIETRVASVEQVRYLDSRPAGFESMTTIRERISLRHGIPPWVINAVMRDVPGAPLPFAMVRSKHADDGAQPYPIWPTADITRRFDRFAAECTFVTAERATHPDIQQGRFKLRQRSPA